MKVRVDEPGTLRIILDESVLTEEGSNEEYTVSEWLSDCVNFAVPQGAVNSVCANRGVKPSDAYVKGDTTQRLLKADLLKWIVLGPGKVNNTSDSDNGWSHSDGGYTLSKEDKKLLMDEANAIYGELEPESVFGKKKTRMRSAGIMPAYRSVDGEPLERRPI